MITFLKFIKKITQMLLNLLFIIQIALMVLVFLTATYWFFNLLGTSVFSFVEPIANVIIDFVKLFYNRDVILGGIYVDSSLLLFDIIAVLTVFVISKSKYYIYRFIDLIDKNILKIKQVQEDNFNKALKTNLENKVKRMNNAAILIQLELIDMLADKRFGPATGRNLDDKTESCYKILFSALKNTKNCSFALEDDMLIILTNDFAQVDNLIMFVEQLINRLKVNLTKERILLNSYVIIDVYDNKSDFKGKIYPIMKQLVNLKQQNEIICMGNFQLRYSQNTRRMYEVILFKGKYTIDGGVDIYTLRKIK